MITTSSKLLYGLGAGSLAAGFVWFVANEGQQLGSVMFAFLAVAFIFMGAIASYTRDGHVLSTDTSAHGTSAAAQKSVGRSLWPFGTAVSAGVTVVGLISSPGIFKVGVALLIAMLAEWMVSNWAERASASNDYNTKVRDYIVHPLELPIAGALLLSVIVLSFSRVFLALSKSAGAIVFAVVGAVILFFGALIALRRDVNRRVVGAILGVVLVALAGTGVATALDGEREQLVEAAEEDHFAERGCTEEKEYSDKKASRAVAMKSSILANVVLTEDGRLYAEATGYPGAQSAISIQRSNPSTILFINESDKARRMVLSFGKVVEDLGDGVEKETALEACTSKVEKGGQQAVTVVIPKPSSASDEPFTITVPGVEGAKIDVFVP